VQVAVDELEPPRGWVEDFGANPSAGRKHSAGGKGHNGIVQLEARVVHLRARRKGVGGWIEDLGAPIAPIVVSIVRPSDDQGRSVRKEGGGMLVPRHAHVPDGMKRSAIRVEQDRKR